MKPPEPLRPAGRLIVWLGVCVLLAWPLARAAESAAAFSFDDVAEKAKALAASPFAPPKNEVPEFLRSLAIDQWRDVRYVPEEGEVWSGGNSLPRIAPLLPGFVLNQTTVINIVDENGIRALPFSAAAIRAGDRELAEKYTQLAPGFAGFRIEPQRGRSGEHPLGVMCASHFNFSAKNGRLGVFSRPIVIDIAAANSESYAMLREYWLCKPQADSDTLTVFALMDSPPLTGAFEFVITPGTSTVLDVHAVFYPRQDAAAPTKIGISPLTGMFLFAETEGNNADYRPEVHNCDGLFFTYDDNDWQWVPLKNPKRLTVSEFPYNSPKSFGFVQRDINFDHYQDLRNRFDLSSSVWVEPKSDWGAGRLELLEIPGSRDFHSNVMVYWVPERNGDSAGEPANGREKNAPLVYDYRMYWTPPGMKMHELGMVRDTRMDRSEEDGTVTFYIDFEGAELNALPADTGLTSVLELPKEVSLVEKQLFKNTVTGGWRLTLKLSLPQSGVLDGLLTARSGPPQLWLAAYLKKGENLPEALTETWRYRVIP